MGVAEGNSVDGLVNDRRTSNYSSVEDIKAAHAARGGHFFDPDSMRFFNSKVSGQVINGRHFVTSERFDQDSPRQYTIREAKPDGSIDTVGDFGGYKTGAQAKRAARNLGG